MTAKHKSASKSTNSSGDFDTDAEGELDVQYVNCHPNTGLLPYFEARDVAAHETFSFQA